MDFIRIGTDYEKDDVALIGEMTIIAEGKDPFWEREARNLVTGLILHVATSRQPALRNMSEVRFLLMQSKRDFDQTLKEMTQSQNSGVRNIGSAFSATEPKVLESIKSVAKSQTSVWESPKLKAISMKTDFDISRLKKEVASFYIIIPPEYLGVYKPVIRLLIGITLAMLMRDQSQPKERVLFLIDEFPALGYMENIEEGIGYLAGYGISLWVFIQDMSQLKASYDKWESFIANCAVRAAFGTNDLETAKTLSDMLGTTTITTKGSGSSKDSGQLLGGNKSTNISETSRQLMTPDEVMRLPYDSQLIFVQGQKPIMADKIFYFSDPAFKGKFGKWG
jgi:type IV secretion system protein VirD4